MIKGFSLPLVAIACSAIVSSAIDRVCAKDKEKEDWVTLDNCQLVPNKANDGDSFHIRSNETEYLVRLYFVDAPETANLGPARLIEQAEYFSVSVPQVIEIGRDAKKFVDAKLSEPFTIITRMAEGLGRSKIQRIYGLVRTKDGDLASSSSSMGLLVFTACIPRCLTAQVGRTKFRSSSNWSSTRSKGNLVAGQQSLRGHRHPLIIPRIRML